MGSKSNRLNEETLKYLISNLRRFVLANAGISPIINEHSEIIDAIVDSLYYNDKSFIELFSDKSFSRERLKSEVITQIPTILSQTETDNYLNRFFISPLKKFLSRKHPEKTTYIVFPLNINFSKVTNFSNNIKYKNICIEIFNYNAFRNSKYYHANITTELKNRCDSSVLMHTKYYFFIFKHKGPDTEYSVEYCCNIFTEILALINLSKNIRITSTMIVNELFAISPIKVSPVFFECNNRKKYINYHYTDNLPFIKNIWYNDGHYKNFIKYLDSISEFPKNSELKELVYNNLRLYNEGITELDISNSGHKFWNSIEGVTKINDKGHVPERANSILKRPSKKWQIKLEILREKRNLFAHESKSEFTESDRQFLKKVSEQMFTFLLNHIKLLKNKSDLELLYLTASRDNSKLKERLELTKREIELIKYVSKERGHRLPKWVKSI